MKNFAIILLGIGTILLGFNIVQGWNLSQTDTLAPDNHLSLALVALGLLILSNILLLKNFGNRIAKGVHRKAMSASGSCLIFSVLTLLSGTFSHAGRFPILHFVFATIVTISAVSGTIFWIKVKN